MGNTPSQEAPRHAGRKLLKPRAVGQDRPGVRVAASVPASQTAVHHIKNSQFSNSYLVGTVPVSAPQTSSIDIGSPVPAANAIHDKPFADREPRSPVFMPRSPTISESNEPLRAERIERRRSTGYGVTPGSGPPSRAPSRPGKPSTQMAARTQSLHSTRTHVGPRDAQVHDEMPRSHSLLEKRASFHSRSNSNGRTGESLDPVCNLRRNSSTPQPEMLSPNRTQSETSLYPPHRRRSLIMTPGVATRADPPKTDPPKMIRQKSSFRNSMGPTPTVSRQNSVDSKTSRHMSLPALPSQTDLTERSPTPNEIDYMQLGVMKFGSLHITNGAPTPSPGQEPDDSFLYAAPAVSTNRNDKRDMQNSFPKVDRDSDVLHMKTKRSRLQLFTKPVPSSPPVSLSPRASIGRAITPTTNNSTKEDFRSGAQAYPAPVTIRPPPPELEIMSKHAAEDDLLFEEDDSPHLTSNGIVAQTVEVAKKMDVGMKTPTRPSLVHVSRKDSGYVSNTSKSSRKTLSTLDSGYGSNASVRSTRQKRVIADGGDYVTSASQSSDSNGSTPSGELPSNDPSPLKFEEGLETEEHTQPSISSKDDASVSTPRTSTSSAPHSLIRLASLGSRKNRDPKQPHQSLDQTGSNPPADLLQRVASPARSATQSSSSPAGSRMSSLRRLLSVGGSRKGLATSYAVHEFDGGVPSVPTAVEEKLQGHSANFPTAPKRLALRVEASHDSLGTIVSVEDAAEPEVTQPPRVVSTLQQTHPAQHRDDRQAPHHYRRRSKGLSISSVSGSITGAANSLLSPKTSLSHRNVVKRRSTVNERPRKSASQGFGMNSDSDDDLILDGTIVDDRDFVLPNVRRSVGNSAFDQAMVGMGDQGRYPTPDKHAWMQEPYVDPRASRRQPQLRNRKSAPDIRQTAAGHLSPVFERDTIKVSMTPPPISMQTRGSKKKKRSSSKSSRRHPSPGGGSPHRRVASHSPYEPASSVPSSFEDLTDFPFPASASISMPGPYPRAAPLPSPGSYARQPSTPKMRRPLFGQRYSFDGHSFTPAPLQQAQQSNLAPMPSRQRQDAWRPNRHLLEKDLANRGEYGSEQGHQGRPSSNRVPGEGQQPPFRVLHSYNSPAYKGIPIWE
ncbi:hypothetical protein LIA77_10486 [Sarocladium implicatum]|nr:hypothetical protein LIA77_10486 [Sarocladium implicatum]